MCDFKRKERESIFLFQFQVIWVISLHTPREGKRVKREIEGRLTNKNLNHTLKLENKFLNYFINYLILPVARCLEIF